jgi:hypothetical protein
MAVTEDKSGGLQKITWTWTSDSNGDATETTTYKYNAAVMKLITIPGDSDLAPTAAYDVYGYDSDGLDVLCALGADRSATATEYKANTDGLGYVKSSTIRFVADAAGELNTGTVVLYLLDLDKDVPTL